jgi:hypothetical protein
LAFKEEKEIRGEVVRELRTKEERNETMRKFE